MAIGVLREGPLHAAIKDALARPGDRVEVPLGGYVIDLVRADGSLVEIQTGAFGPLGPKLDALLDSHVFRIVHPVPLERRIVRVDEEGELCGAPPRRSPLRGSVLDVFDRLVSFPSLLAHPNLSIEVLLTREDHLRGPAPVKLRRRTRDPGRRHLTGIDSSVVLEGPDDVRALLPAGLADAPFTTRELAAALKVRLVLAQRIAYCLRALEITEDAGRRARAPLHALV